VANYHNETVKSFVELMAAAGIQNLDEIKRYPALPETELPNASSADGPSFLRYQ